MAPRLSRALTGVVLLLTLMTSSLCHAGLLDTIAQYAETASQALADQNLVDIQNGVINISDETLNSMLAITVGGSAGNSVQAIHVEIKPDNNITTDIKTNNVSYEISAHIDQLTHNSSQSLIVLNVTGKKITDGGLWNCIKNFVLSLCSVQTLTNWFGVPQFQNGIKLTVKSDTVTMDYHEWLYKTKFGALKLFGKRVLDIVTVNKIETSEHNMKVYTTLSW